MSARKYLNPKQFHEMHGPTYHGTDVDLAPGSLIEPGHETNVLDTAKGYVYTSRSQDDASHFADVAARNKERNSGWKNSPRRHVYQVEATGRMMPDPNDWRGRYGNPVEHNISFRSRKPLRVVKKVSEYHPDEAWNHLYG